MTGFGAVIVSLLVALLLALPGTGRAGRLPAELLQQVDWSAASADDPGDLCGGNVWMRNQLFGKTAEMPDGSEVSVQIPATANVATFRIALKDADGNFTGETEDFAMPSVNSKTYKSFPPAGNDAKGVPFERLKVTHSERRLWQALQQAGITADQVIEICSEYEPCDSGSTCQALLSIFKNLKKVYFNWRYADKSTREVSEHDQTLEEHYAELDRAQAVLNGCVPPEGGGGGETGDVVGLRSRRVPSRSSLAVSGGDCPSTDEHNGPSEEPEDGPLANELSDPAEALDPGGIDFTSLQLRYMSLSGPHQGDVQYAMDSDGAPVTTNPGTGLQTAQEDSDAFFTWLTLPPSTFWVNLSPNSPPNIIDPRLALTDAGRVLLQSDLLLKQASAVAENPATPTGAQFWPPMLALPPGSDTYAGSSPCGAFRLWIVPGVATVHATKTQLYILSAPLQVKMAVVTHLPGTLLDPICPQDTWTTTYENTFRQLILPQIIEEVNTAPQWEPLRRVYMSRVAAQWVRQEAGPNTVMGRLIDSGLHRSWIAQPSWSPYAIWQQYLEQFNAAPISYTVPVTEPNGTKVNASVYVSGGVDLRHKIRERDTSTREFKTHWRGLAAAAKRATKRPSTADGTTLVGGGTTVGPKVKLHKRPLFLIVPRGA